MKRSQYISIIAAVILTIPLIVYQNFLLPAQTDLPSLTREGVNILNPLENQVISMLEDQFLVWLESDREIKGQLKIKDNFGKTLLEKDLNISPGEFELTLDVNEELRKVRRSWLFLEIYSNNELVARSRFGWGLIFLTAGEANVANYLCESCTDSGSLSHVVFLTDSNNSSDSSEQNEIGELQFVPATATSPLAGGSKKNAWYFLGQKIWQEHGIPVAFINTGWSGSGILNWIDPTSLYHRLQYGQHFNLSAVLWHQGESNAGRTSREDYRAMLFDLIEQTRSTFEYEVPWYVARSFHCEAKQQGQEREIVAAQNDVINQMGLSNVFTGPNTSTIPHSCQFETPEQMKAYVDGWYHHLKNSSLLSKILN